jgi:hypothetical protein
MWARHRTHQLVVSKVAPLMLSITAGAVDHQASKNVADELLSVFYFIKWLGAKRTTLYILYARSAEGISTLLVDYRVGKRTPTYAADEILIYVVRSNVFILYLTFFLY